MDDVVHAWVSWLSRSQLICEQFKYLDCFYVKRMGLPTLVELCLKNFANALVRTMQPMRLLAPGVQISTAALTLPDEQFDEQAAQQHAEKQVQGMQVAKLREVLLASGDDTDGTKPMLKKRLINLICADMRAEAVSMRAEAVAAVEAERSRVLHPRVDALVPARVVRLQPLVDVRPVIITEILMRRKRAGPSRLATLLVLHRNGITEVGITEIIARLADLWW